MANNTPKYDVPSGAVRVTDLQQINPRPGEWHFVTWKQASSGLPTRDETGNRPNPYSTLAHSLNTIVNNAGRKPENKKKPFIFSEKDAKTIRDMMKNINFENFIDKDTSYNGYGSKWVNPGQNYIPTHPYKLSNIRSFGSGSFPKLDPATQKILDDAIAKYLPGNVKKTTP